MDKTVELLQINPRIPGVWEALRTYLQEGLLEGGGDKDWSLDDIYTAAVENRIQLWGLVVDGYFFGSCVTVQTVYPRRTVLEVLVLGTDPHTDVLWLQALDILKSLAQEHGCDAIVGTGRPGWARKLNGTERRIFEVKL